MIGVSAYAGLWLQKVTTHEPVGKIGFAAFATAVAQIEGAFTTALMFVLVAWGVDFAVGVARAIADPQVRLVEYKVRHGLLRLLAIPLLAIAAAVIEGMTIAAIAWDPDGKFVLAVCVAMFWEECVSIQRNGQFFYHRLRIIEFPWNENGHEDGDGNGREKGRREPSKESSDKGEG